MAELNIYQKLQKARVEFQGMKINKSGENKFAHYKYFELGDFIPQINTLFDKYGLCSVISFKKELATMTLYDSGDATGNTKIIITSPMSEANLSGGCSPVQNLGACQSYLRRYLYLAALEIVENDVLDATTGNEPALKPAPKPTPRPAPTPDTTRKDVIARIVNGEPTVYPLNAAIQSARVKHIGVTDINDETIPTQKLIEYLTHIVKKFQEKGKTDAKSE